MPTYSYQTLPKAVGGSVGQTVTLSSILAQELGPDNGGSTDFYISYFGQAFINDNANGGKDQFSYWSAVQTPVATGTVPIGWGTVGTASAGMANPSSMIPGPAQIAGTQAVGWPISNAIAQLADYEINGYWNWDHVAPHHFASNTITYNVDGFGNATDKALAMQALQEWQDVCNVTFVQTSGPAQITFIDLDAGAGNSYAESKPIFGSQGAYTGATITVTSQYFIDWGTSFDTFTFESLVHEIGHALGLGHTGPYDGTNPAPTWGVSNLFPDDTQKLAVMSYFNQNYVDGVGTAGWTVTPRMADIYAVHELYGAATGTRTGDTIYGFHSTAGPVYDFSNYSDGPPAMTIYDSGGKNTLDCSGYSVGQTINLTPGSFSSIGGLTNNINIAEGTHIQNAIGGSNDDTFITAVGDCHIDGGGSSGSMYSIGNALDYTWDTHGITVDLAHHTVNKGSVIESYAVQLSLGTDSFSDIEAFYGGSSADIFRSAADGKSYTFYGKGGTLDYSWDNSMGLTINVSDHKTAYAGAIVEAGTVSKGTSYSGGIGQPITPHNGGTDSFTGIDTFKGGTFGTTFKSAADGHSYIFDGGVSGYDTVSYAGAAASGIIANVTGHNGTVSKGAGLGTDALTDIESIVGSTGSDIFYVDANETVSGNGGFDYLIELSAAVNLSLGFSGISEFVANTGNNKVSFAGDTSMAYVYGSTGNDTLTLGSGGGYLFGEGGNDWLVGGTGNDILDGGTGIDTMTGGRGDDTFYVDDEADGIIELANEGDDTVYSTVNYTLPANVEQLYLQEGAPAAINGAGNDVLNIIHGNALDNALSGYGGNDVLLGGGGNDILDGGAGNDAMAGGLGDDTYYVDREADTIIENPNEGHDTVFSTMNYTLSDNFETLFLVEGAPGAINGAGNSVQNFIYGNSLDNALSGYAGDDVLVGGAGNDILDGGTGNDTMAGGTGDDTYYVDSEADSIYENPNEGHDTVFSTMNYTLSDNFETLFLVEGAPGAINGAGNSVQNFIYGNSLANALSGYAGDDVLVGGAGNDILDGGTGNDTMAGGTGDDTYYVDSEADTIIENPNEGTDTVFASINYTLADNFETLFLQEGAAAAINGDGNSGDNHIYGNSLANALSGNGGRDFLFGGAGNDTFVFQAGQADGDTILDFAGVAVGEGDQLRFVGFGTAGQGATFTQVGAGDQWQIHSGLDGHNEMITLLNHAQVHAPDCVFA